MIDADTEKRLRLLACRLASRAWEDRCHRELRDQAAREICALLDTVAELRFTLKLASEHRDELDAKIAELRRERDELIHDVERALQRESDRIGDIVRLERERHEAYERAARIVDEMAAQSERDLEPSGYARWYRERAAAIRALTKKQDAPTERNADPA